MTNSEQWKAARRLIKMHKTGFMDHLELLSFPNCILKKYLMELNSLEAVK